MQQGRRTASLKASIQAVNSGLQGINKDFTLARETTGVVSPAVSSVPTPTVASLGVPATATIPTTSSPIAASNSPVSEPKPGRQKKFVLFH